MSFSDTAEITIKEEEYFKLPKNARRALEMYQLGCRRDGVTVTIRVCASRVDEINQLIAEKSTKAENT